MIELLFATDDRYTPILAAALVSIRDNRNNDDVIRIHIFEDGVTPENMRKLYALQDDAFRIVFYDISVGIQDIRKKGVPPFKESWMTYARLLCGSTLSSDIGRVLYLDCDVMVKSSLGKLFETDMDGRTIAAACDIVPLTYLHALGIQSPFAYFNGGVLLIDLKRWREDNVEDSLFGAILKDKRAYHYADQDWLNLQFAKTWKVLPMRYCIFYPVYHWPYKCVVTMREGDEGFYEEADYLKETEKPVIIHMTGIVNPQPWKQGSKGEEREEWLSYLRKTSFWEEFEFFPNQQSRASHLLCSTLYCFLPFKLWFRIFLWRWRIWTSPDAGIRQLKDNI